MAKVTSITLVDDLDGKAADETVEFGVDGKTYEIDLAAPKARQLRDILQPYILAARTRSGRRRTAAPPARTYRQVQASREANSAIREWASKHGIKVAERGRIPKDVLDKYAASLDA
jgi:hypothetical protein